MRDNLPLLICSSALGLVAVVLHVAGWPVLEFVHQPELYFTFLLFGLAGLALRVLQARLEVRSYLGLPISNARIGWSRAFERVRRDFCNVAAVSRAGVAMVCLAFCLALFAGWKRLIPSAVPFYLDPVLEQLDTALHGGIPPWIWLEPLNQPWLTRLLDQFYFFSIGGSLVFLGWMVWSRNPLRSRVLVGLVVLLILLGNLAATAMSSAGPTFLAENFGSQRAYLQSIPGLISVDAQVAMWRSYSSGMYDHYAAISAMPSIHVATPVFLVLVGIVRYPWIRWPGVALIALTVVTSVHLGWHYAVDGYVSILAVWAYCKVIPVAELGFNRLVLAFSHVRVTRHNGTGRDGLTPSVAHRGTR